MGAVGNLLGWNFLATLIYLWLRSTSIVVLLRAEQCLASKGLLLLVGLSFDSCIPAFYFLFFLHQSGPEILQVLVFVWCAVPGSLKKAIIVRKSCYDFHHDSLFRDWGF